MTMKYVLYFVVLAVSLEKVRADFSKESEKSLLKVLNTSMEECAKEMKLNMDEVMNKSSGISGDNYSCLYSCILKNKGLLDEEGKLKFDKVLEVMKEIIPNDDDFQVVENIVKSCSLVNDEKVTDGVKGCQRARFLVSCIMTYRM